jgi:hypothetical protein
MADYRLNVTLDPERAAKLAALADRSALPAGTLARALLSTAIDEAPPSPASVVELLDAIPGAWERIEQGRRDAGAGRTIPLDALR